MKALTITLLALVLVACQNNENTLVLKIKNQGYYIGREEIVNLNKYLNQVQNSESVNLVIMTDSRAKTSLLIDAVNYAENAKFKKISLTSLNVQ
jgi:biopolymer transport protein ExbD